MHSILRLLGYCQFTRHAGDLQTELLYYQRIEMQGVRRPGHVFQTLQIYFQG
jgi:hypothetical protein